MMGHPYPSDNASEVQLSDLIEDAKDIKVIQSLIFNHMCLMI